MLKSLSVHAHISDSCQPTNPLSRVTDIGNPDGYLSIISWISSAEYSVIAVTSDMQIKVILIIYSWVGEAFEKVTRIR